VINTGKLIEFYVEKIPRNNFHHVPAKHQKNSALRIKVLHITMKKEGRVRVYVLTHLWFTSRKFDAKPKSKVVTALVLSKQRSLSLFPFNTFRNLATQKLAK
jgi:hypothetical protein